MGIEGISGALHVACNWGCTGPSLLPAPHLSHWWERLEPGILRANVVLLLTASKVLAKLGELPEPYPLHLQNGGTHVLLARFYWDEMNIY